LRNFTFRAIAGAFVLATTLAATHSSLAQDTREPNQPQDTPSRTHFEPLQLWKGAVLAGSASTLTEMYSANPAAEIAPLGGKPITAAEEVEFWTSLKKSGLRSIALEVVRFQALRSDVVQAILQLELNMDTPSGPQKRYASVGQAWVKQGERWRIVESRRTALARLPQPALPSNLYAADADAEAEIKAALAKAASGHKRVLVVFGANWCYDCHVLDAAFHSPEIAALVNANYEVVHVDIGQGDRNQDLMKRYNVPLEKGIPALAVLDNKGELLFSQKHGEFESARSLGPEDLVSFLNRWKP
jgi:thiol-disulfide isomerase/thioredoxin